MSVALAGIITVASVGSAYATTLVNNSMPLMSVDNNTSVHTIAILEKECVQNDCTEKGCTAVAMKNDVVNAKFVSKELENVLKLEAAKKEEEKEQKKQAKLAKKKAKELEEQKEKEAIFHGYTNVGIADVADYVNIRKTASTDSEKIGKLHADAICQVIRKTEDGWYKIQSGEVKGYVSAEYVLVGEEAEERALSLATTKAVVNADILVVRSKPSTESDAVAKVRQGYEFEVIEEKKEWIKVSYKETECYVYAEFVDLKETTLSIADAIELRDEEREEEQEKEREAQENINRENGFKAEDFDWDELKDVEATDAQREIVDFAMEYLGNPYVYGGTSLTDGTDCSGFTQSVYGNFGYYLNRTSRDQTKNGTKVDMEDIQPGDLLFYSYNGTIGHVAIYAGDGKIVHASTEETGIIVSDAFHNEPTCAVRILEEDDVVVSSKKSKTTTTKKSKTTTTKNTKTTKENSEEEETTKKSTSKKSKTTTKNSKKADSEEKTTKATKKSSKKTTTEDIEEETTKKTSSKKTSTKKSSTKKSSTKKSATESTEEETTKKSSKN